MLLLASVHNPLHLRQGRQCAVRRPYHLSHDEAHRFNHSR